MPRPTFHTIHISAEAHQALSRRTLPGHTLSTEFTTFRPDGSVTVQVDDEVLSLLETLRADGETISSVILQLCLVGGYRAQ